MGFFIDFNSINQSAQDPFTFFLWITRNFWYIFAGWAVFYILPYIWVHYLRSRYDKKRSYTLLAIDIPKNNEQSPKAVEHIFEHLSGIPASLSFADKWRDGVIPESFSLEIVSMGGYIQFLIQTPTKFRDLVEAAIYAQYPDAEIVEVEDYAQKTIGLKFPNDEYDLWGNEFQMTAKQYFPIRLWADFEHSLSQELKDPMAALMETLSTLGPDEQIWIQLVITPAPDSWKNPAEALIKKMVGKKPDAHKTWLDKTSDLPLHFVRVLGDVNLLFGGKSEEEKKEESFRVMNLTPGEKLTLQGMEFKVSKLGFYTKFRMIYIARKKAFSKSRGVFPVLGAIKQFNWVGGNGFRGHKRRFFYFINANLAPTSDLLIFQKWRNDKRKNKILRLYRNRARALEPGYYGFVLNTEELATVYHFPVMTVKTPLVKKTESKKAEPPVTLPIEDEFEIPEGVIEEDNKSKKTK